MIDDPIVEEVRKARQDLFEKCGCDLDRFMEFLRESQSTHAGRLITTLKKQNAKEQVVSK
jgi:hypothetical protein